LEGCKAIEDMLHVDTCLKSLNLERNHIGFSGFRYIMEGLKLHTMLVSLNLSRTSLGNEGALLVSQLLKLTTSLLRLNLRCNNIGPKGCKLIADSLIENISLGYLDLSNNPLGGCTALGMLIRKNTKLHWLGLRETRMGQDNSEDIAAALAVNTNIIFMSIGVSTRFAAYTSILAATLDNRSLDALGMKFDGIKGLIKPYM